MATTSIIIRTLNEERHIGNLLESLQKQTYSDFEIVMVDSGSTDDTLAIARKYPVKIVEIESRNFTFGYSLNVGCKAASGDFLVFVSAHVLPMDTEWLGNLVAPFKNERVAMVYGKQRGTKESKFSEQMDFKRMFGRKPINSHVPLEYANNANAAVRRALWEKHPFDEYLFGLEDIEWAKCMLKEGYSVHYEPSAGIYHIHNEAWYQVLNRYRREAIAAVRIGLAHPPQARVNLWWTAWNFFLDLLNTFPNYSRARIDEIIRFRYFQWKGSKLGWEQGRDIDFERERNSIFYPEQNLAVVIKGVDRAAIEPVPLPEMLPGDILIKVEYVGVCRTDIEVYEGTLGYYRDGVATYPITPGHEFSGTIAKIGSNNRFQERFKIGDRVVGECILSRGEHGKRAEVGVINHNGAYAQHVVVPGDAVHKIPDTLSTKAAVLTEPLAVVLRALRRLESRLTPKARIAVIGAGQIGNLSTQVLAHRGYHVELFDSNSDRLKLVESSATEVHSVLESLESFDVVIEATGSKPVLDKVLSESKVDSTLMLLGFPYGSTEYNFEDIVGKEKVVMGSVGADEEDFVAALKLLPLLKMDPFTEIALPLKDFKEAWEAQRRSKYLKVLLKP